MINLEKLQELKRLKDSGVITEEEFETLKKEELSKHISVQEVSSSDAKTEQKEERAEQPIVKPQDKQDVPLFNKKEKKGKNKIMLLLLGTILLLTIAGGIVFTAQKKEEADKVAKQEAVAKAKKEAEAEAKEEEEEVAKKEAEAKAKKKAEKKKVYKTAKIGSQVWMGENLNVSYFRNGDPIPNVKTNSAWNKASKEGRPAWCYYDNYSANGKIYGKLYNWHAVNDPRGLAPRGWHVATDKEWTILIGFLGGEDEAGYNLKSSTGWRVKGGKKGANKSGFTALPGGNRDNHSGNFYGKGKRHGKRHAQFWTSTEGKNKYTGSYETWTIGGKTVDMSYNNGRCTIHTYQKGNGRSVRCIKD